MTEKLPWYKDGLRFSCTQCGKCCTGPSGYVWVDDQEIEEMAKFLKISMEEFVRKYLRKVGSGFALLEVKRGGEYDCVFLKNKQCQLYSARPKQCRVFPWWPENLSSPKAWKKTAERCEGINEEAPLIPLSQIQNQIDNL